jgi:hypothetical protein
MVYSPAPSRRRERRPHSRTAGSSAAGPIATGGKAHRGLTAVEALIVLVIIAVVVLLVLMAMPREREQACMVACRRNLSQIGFGLALFDQVQRQLPTVGALGGIDEPAASRAPGPLWIILDTLQLPDLTELKDATTPPEARSGLVITEIPVAGFICASDRNATAGRFIAPISYRAATGSGPTGADGAFAPGRVLSLKTIEAGDGLSHTAGFSERLVGDGAANRVAPCNYQVVPDLLSSSGCPDGSDPSAWHGDAGSSWTSSDYRCTLYNHALPPGGHPSCVARNGKTGFMGASSGHVRGVNVLLMDGAVTVLRRSIDQTIWKELATVGAPASDEPGK